MGRRRGGADGKGKRPWLVEEGWRRRSPTGEVRGGKLDRGKGERLRGERARRVFRGGDGDACFYSRHACSRPSDRRPTAAGDPAVQWARPDSGIRGVRAGLGKFRPSSAEYL